MTTEEIEAMKAEILANYQSMMEPIYQETNERMKRARTSERMAEIQREFIRSTAPIRDMFAKQMASLPIGPIVIAKDDLGL